MDRSCRHDPDDVRVAAAFLRSGIIPMPEVALLTGTGLGDITDSAAMHTAIDYRDIPHFPASTVQSHYGRLSAVVFNGVPLLVLQGRFHLYEGYLPRQVAFPVRVLQELGVRTLILTNAAGGLNPYFAAGDIMVIEDHINLTGDNPLVGPNDDRWGPRFPEMIHAYDSHLQALAWEGSTSSGAGARKGIYAGLKGPSLETPAEMRYLRTLGADAVGFSTVMETIAAVHAGMRVVGLSVITNVCRPEASVSVSVDEIIAVAQSAAPRLAEIIHHVIKRLVS
jgi:purine-nucleoside phosphorylase